ncbi:MAG: HEAT repeat domain-containing protein [Verrucomicrobiota bacterium]|jgi:HEAT repeat protein
MAWPPRAISAPAPTAGDIPRLVNEAAACQTGQSLEPFRGLETLVRGSVSEPALRKPLEAGLVRLLGPASSLEAKRFACQQLAIVGGSAALPALARLLANEETAGIACLALTTYPPGKADGILRDALPSVSGAARIQVITALGDRRDSRAVRVLAQRADDGELAVAEAAIAALGKIGDAAARKAIAVLGSRARPALAPALAEAALRGAERLGAAGDRRGAIAAYEELLDSSPAGCVRRGALEALLRLDEDRRQQRILAALHGMDSFLKPVAIAAVRTLPAGVSSEPFVAELHNLTPVEQVWMIDSLAARDDLGARLAIYTSVSSPNRAVRLAAIQALSRVGDPSLVSMFAGALGSAKTAEESRVIETALVNLRGGAAADKAITAEVKRCGGKARAGVMSALAQRVGPAANPVFFGETESKDPAVARAAFRALGKTAEESDVPSLVEALVNLRDKEVRPDAENAAVQGLAKMQSAPSRSALVRGALGRAHTIESRRSLLGLLPGCADARALDALKTAAADPDPGIRDAAIRALADWPDAAAWDTLAGVCNQPGNETAQGLALRGLVRLAREENAHPDSALVGRYLALVGCARTDAQFKLVLGALAGVANPDALHLAAGLLTRPGVRPEAEAAVRKIAEAIKGQYPEAAQQALRQIQPAK